MREQTPATLLVTGPNTDSHPVESARRWLLLPTTFISKVFYNCNEKKYIELTLF